MTLANVALTDTFDLWRTRTNQLVFQSNFYKDNYPNYLFANNIGVTANAFASSTIAGANAAIGLGANSYANVVWSRANTRMDLGGFQANSFASATIAGANTAARDATNLTSGTVPSARISGSYTGITGVGTITTGVWNGTDIAVADGGTGASDASTARTNLGLAIGTNVQAWDANLDQIAALAPTLDNFIVGNGTAWTLETPASARTSLGLGTIATQGSGAVTITGGSISGITDLAVADGGTGASDASTARTNLGLGTMSTQGSGAVTITGGSITGITDIALADGGTNASLTASAGAVAYSTASAIAFSGVGASGQVLTSAGTSAPTWSNGLPVTQIPNAANLNTYTTPGLYHQSSDSQATAGTNYPVALSGILEVHASSLMVYQRYTVYNSGRIYTRSSYNGSWYSWLTNLDSSSFNSFAPSLTGTSASGTWGISITGSAAQLGGVAAASYARKDTSQSYSGSITVSDGSGVAAIQTSGDIYAYRSGGTTGVLFLNAAGNRYLYNDGSNYQLPTGGLVVGGDITAFASDERLKKDIVEIQNPLDKLSQIRGVHYRHNDFALEQGLPDEAFVGVIAQEIEKVLPEVVTLAPFDYEGVDSNGKKISKSGENYKTVKYEKIVPLLIEAIKELTAKVEMLESKAGK